MRKTTFTLWRFLATLLIAVFVSFGLSAQNYIITNSPLNVGNPGGVRTASDITNSGGSQVIDGATGSATQNYWSNGVSIPFSFDFAGSTVTHFIVSKNGLMSFDTTMSGMPVPSALNVNTSLPNANLPNNTIAFFWEDTSSTSVSSGDYVYVNEEGTAPNRQLWIRYYSFEVGSQSFCYWACVLEETTNRIHVMDMSYAASPTNYTGTVGVQTNATTAWQVTTPLNGSQGSPNIEMGSGGSGTTDNEYYTFEYFAPGACLPPSGLGSSNISSTGADVSWTTGNSQNAYVEYGASGFIPGSGSGMGMYVTGLTSASLSGLTPNTTYDVYVKDSCALTGSYFIGPETFTTLCAAQTSGTVTIDPTLPASATNFQSFTAFANDVNGCGIGGPVTVNVKQGTYTEQVAINSIVGSSSTNTITIQADPANTMPVLLTYAPAGSGDNYTLDLTGCSNITIDGLTLESTGTTYSRIALVGGATENITFSNNIFNGPVSSGTTTNNCHIYYGAGIEIDGLTISDNEFNNGTTIVYLTGSSSSPSDNFVFTGNTVNGFSGYGVYCTYWQNVNVSNNSFQAIASTTTQYGVYFSTSAGTPGEQAIIEKNDIRLNTTGTLYGVYITYFGATALAPSVIINNMVSNETTTSTGTRIGIYTLASNYLNVYHNSVSILDGSATSGRGFYINSSTTFTTGNINVKNNIFSNMGPGYAAEISSNATADVTSMDYNVFNYDLANAGPLRYSNTNYANLAAWQVGTMLDANSVEGDPLFVSFSDLHLVGSIADNAGDNSVGVTVDIDGDTRPASGSSTVDIGADEYTAANCTPPINAIAFNVLATTADISWSPTVGSPDSTMVEYGLSGFVLGSGMKINVLSPDTNIALSGLTPQSDYEYYLTQGCSSSNSITVGPYPFTTACAAVMAPFTENFDGLALTSPYTDLPACWDPQVGPDYWDVTNDVTNNGHAYLPNIGDHTTGTDNYMWIDASSDILANEMITTFVDMSSLTTPYAGFWFASNNTNNSINHTIAIDAWDGTAWVNITTETGNFPGWVKVAGIVPTGIPSTTKFRIYAIANPLGNSGDYYFNDLGVDDFFVEEAPTCFVPTMLGSFNTTSTSVNVFWTSGGAANYNVEYGEAGFIQGTGVFSNETNDTVLLSSLTPDTEYEFYVRDSCGVGDVSTWAGPYSFYTGYCQVVSTASGSYFDDFTTSGGVTNISNLTSGYATNGYQDASTLSVSQYPGVSIGFNTSLVGTTVGVNIWVDWNNDLDFDSSEKVYASAGYVSAASGSFSVPINAAMGDYRMRIRCDYNSTDPNPCGTSGSGRNETEDYTISVLAPLPCTSPTAVGATNITASSAEVFWTTGGASNWDIQYGTSGFSLGSGTAQSPVNDTVLLSSLASGTAYDLYVRDSCGLGDVSLWVGPFTFSTLVSCPDPTALGATNLTTTSADIYWTTGGSSNWDVQYGTVGFTLGSGTALSVLNDTVALTSLTSGTAYDFYVRDSCGLGDVSTWVGPFTFATMCNTLTSGFTESFEGSVFPPTCWSVINDGDPNTWFQSVPGVGTANSGTKVARIDYNSSIAHDDYLITPKFTVTANTTDQISLFGRSRSSTFLEEFNVLISTTGNQKSDFTVALNTALIVAPITWQEYIFDLSAYVGQDVYVAIQAVSTNEWELYIDDVTVSANASCADPTNLAAVPSCTDATLTWDSEVGATSTIQWGVAGSVPPTGNNINNAVSPYILSGLTEGVSYDFWVLDTCVSGAASTWVGPISFTTDTMPKIAISATLVSSGSLVNYDFDVTSGATGATSVDWDFGDGNTGTGASTNHDYIANGTYTVICVVTNACGVDSATTTALVEGIGIEELAFTEINIYPNPSSGILNIEGLNPNFNNLNIDVINTVGQIVFSPELYAGQTEVKLDLSGLTNGLYHVRVLTNEGVFTVKVVLQHK